MTSFVGRKGVTDIARRALEDSNGVLFVGPAGIGKSALADELARELTSDGWHVEPIRCSEMTTALAFAPLMHVMSPTASPDPTQLSRSLIDELVHRAGTNRLVLIVDDLQHSDPGTAAVIFSLVVHHQARVVASSRANNVTLPAVQTLWKDGHLQRLDLQPLDSRAVAELAETVTKTPLDAELRSALIHRAAGNPFYTLALTRAGLATGAIQERAGLSTIARPLPPSAEVNDLLRSELSSLTNAQLEIMQAIAIGENMPIELFGDLEEQRTIDYLIGAGLVVVDRKSATHATRCAHPLIGEYLRAQLPPGRSTMVLRALIDRVGAYPAASALDILRAVTIGLDANIEVPTTMLLDGAAIALNVFDVNLAKTAAQRVCDNEPTGQSHLLLARALAMSGVIDEANEHFDQAQTFGLMENQLADLAIARSQLIQFFEFDPVRSGQILQDAFATLTTQNARAKVGAALIYPLSLTGQFREAMKLCRELATFEDIDPHTELSVLSMLTLGSFLSASFDGLDKIIKRGHKLLEETGIQNSLILMHFRMAEAILLAVRGAFEASIAAIHTAVDLYVISPASGGVSAGWSAMLATNQVITGNLVDAVTHTAIALQETELDDSLQMAPMLVAARTAALCQVGERAQAQAVLDAAPSEPYLADPRSAIWKAWADTWLLAESDPISGAALAAEASQRARDLGLNYWAWTVLYSGVLIGHPESVVTQLEEEARTSPCVQSSLLARHARAAADRNPAALCDVAAEFTDCGGWASAAAAFAVAAEIEGQAGATTLANRASVRAALAQARAGGNRSPILDTIKNPLTEPELEVARLAANGASSKAIAEARFVSARTVDNQLRSVYKKLGLNSRAELTELLT